MNPAFYTPASYDTAAINVAIAAAAANGGGEVILPAGVYSPLGALGNPVPIVGAGNVALRGTRGATIIRIPLHMVFQDFLIRAQGCDDFHVSGVTFDMGDIDPPDLAWPNQSGAILLGASGGVGGSNCSVTNCEILNMGRYALTVRGGSRKVRIVENVIVRNAASGDPNIAIMLRKDDGTANFTPEISSNITENTCGYSGASWRGVYNNNIMRGSGFGGNFVLDADPNCTGNIVSGNVCSNLQSLPPGLGGDGMEIWSTDSLIANNVTDANAGWGIVIAGRDNTVIGHRSANNASHGIYIDGSNGGSAHNTFLDGCKTRGNGGLPYFIDSGIVGTVLGSNDFR